MRPSRDEYFLRLAELAATMTTCVRRGVGAVAVDADGRETIGYNGVASGQPHCNEGHPCRGAMAASGTQLDACGAIHAEINVLMKCPDVKRIRTIYLTCSPCVSCIKALLCTSCERLVFREEYPAPGARELWLSAGRAWTRMPDERTTLTSRSIGQNHVHP